MRFKFLPSGHIPDLHNAGRITRREQSGAVRRETQAPHACRAIRLNEGSNQIVRDWFIAHTGFLGKDRNDVRGWRDQGAQPRIE